MDLKPRKSEEPELNMTSLIDVVLLMVIFFMVSSTFVEEGRVKIRLPEASTAPISASPAGPLIVTVTHSGEYLVNDRTLINNNPDTLRSAIVKVMGEKRNGPVTIRADATTTHQSVVTAMDVLARLGFTEINIATIPGARSK
ncbi:MAG TPA: biopolymer transporter ExbD [Steroidobacteraceae bacterium]|nr:biopolymer transporter ExbD [Steroidobacteraceae bacterium]